MLLFQYRSKAKDRKITDYDSVNCLCSIQQFAAAGVPLPVGGQYVLIEPGASPVLYVTRSETEDKSNNGSEGGIFNVFLNAFSNLPLPPFITNLLPSSGTSETTTAASKPDETATNKPEKVRTPKPQAD
jgi:hypothetical protein